MLFGDESPAVGERLSPTKVSRKTKAISSSGGIDVDSGCSLSAPWLVRKAEFAYDRLHSSEEAYRLARQAYAVDPFDERGLLIYVASMVDLQLKNELFYLGQYHRRSIAPPPPSPSLSSSYYRYFHYHFSVNHYCVHHYCVHHYHVVVIIIFIIIVMP